MLSGALPFQAAHASRCPRYAMVQQRGVRVLCEANGFSAAATDLLVAMIEPDPTRRLSASGVLSSRWVQPALPTDSPFVAPAGSLLKWSAILGDGRQPGSRTASLDPAPPPPALDVSTTTISSSLNGAALLAEGKRRPSDGLESSAAQRPRTDDGTGSGGGEGSESGGGAGAPANVARGGPPPAPVPHLLGGLDPAEDVPPGVNGMLVRSLGWVQLPEEKEKMVGDVASALDSLGVKYEVVKGELSDVVYVGGQPDAEDEAAAAARAVAASTAAAATLLTASDGGSSNGTSSAPAAPAAPAAAMTLAPAPAGSSEAGVGPEPSSPKYTAGQLCVRLRVVPDDAADGSQIHIDRQAGDVLQFHAFYRDVRNQLAGANGWVNVHGRYEHNVYEEEAGGAPPAGPRQ